MDADVSARLARAVDYFTSKYGCAPTLCYIHPDMLCDELHAPQGIRIETSARVLRNHIWVEFPLAD